RRDPVAAAVGVHGTPEEERGDVGADGRGDADQGLGGEVGPLELVEGEDRRRRVRAPAPEPGRYRDALVDRDGRAGRLAAGLMGPGAGGPLDQRLTAGVGELPRSRAGHGHAESIGGFGSDDVVELEGQDHRLDVVVAVLANAEHTQEDVELRMRAPGDAHAGRAFAIRANAARSSSSGRAEGSTPASPRIALGSSAPSRRSAPRIAFRRCPNASSITRHSAVSSTTTAGRARRSIRTIADATDGRGQNTDGGTGRRMDASPWYVTRRLVGP